MLSFKPAEFSGSKPQTNTAVSSDSKVRYFVVHMDTEELTFDTGWLPRLILLRVEKVNEELIPAKKQSPIGFWLVVYRLDVPESHQLGTSPIWSDLTKDPQMVHISKHETRDLAVRHAELHDERRSMLRPL